MEDRGVVIVDMDRVRRDVDAVLVGLRRERMPAADPAPASSELKAFA